MIGYVQYSSRTFVLVFIYYLLFVLMYIFPISDWTTCSKLDYIQRLSALVYFILLLNTVHTYFVLLLSQGHGPICLIIDSHSWSNHKSLTLIFCLLLCYRHYDRIHVSVIFTVQLFHLLSHHGFYFVLLLVPTNFIPVSNELHVQNVLWQRLVLMATYFLSATYWILFRDDATSRYNIHFDFTQNHPVAGLIIICAHNIKGSVFIRYIGPMRLLVRCLSHGCLPFTYGTGRYL